MSGAALPNHEDAEAPLTHLALDLHRCRLVSRRPRSRCRRREAPGARSGSSGSVVRARADFTASERARRSARESSKGAANGPGSSADRKPVSLRIARPSQELYFEGPQRRLAVWDCVHRPSPQYLRRSTALAQRSFCAPRTCPLPPERFDRGGIRPRARRRLARFRTGRTIVQSVARPPSCGPTSSTTRPTRATSASRTTLAARCRSRDCSSSACSRIPTSTWPRVRAAQHDRGAQGAVDAIAEERGYACRDEINVSRAGLGDAYEAKIKTFFAEHLHGASSGLIDPLSRCRGRGDPLHSRRVGLL